MKETINYKLNMNALKEVNPELAKEIDEADWPKDCQFRELSEGDMNALDQITCDRAPIAFGGATEAPTIEYCLQNQFRGLHGMTRVHYLWETCPQNLKTMFNMFEFSDAITSEELIIFDTDERGYKKFTTLRYPHPEYMVWNTDLKKGKPMEESKAAVALVYDLKKNEYYTSDEYVRRRELIAQGKCTPRILILTCRWTTFLKYCAADFDKAFKQLGCETRFLIEENDVQSITSALILRTINELKPDIFFMVTHARPSVQYLPKELSVVSYIQDRCGPLLELDRLEKHIESHDLFVCQAGMFMDYLGSKGVPDKQMFVLPVPADETVFHPFTHSLVELDIYEKYACDIAIVNHGTATPKEVFHDFHVQYIKPIQDKKLREQVYMFFYKLWGRFTDGHLSEAEMCKMAEKGTADNSPPGFIRDMKTLITVFNVTVASVTWRYQFLKALAKSGLKFRLYGKNWDKYPELKPFAQGPVDRETQLNDVYNFSKINLSINHVNTMHQRLSECALAGGFIMAAYIPMEKDWEPARHYFTCDELTYFDSPTELIQMCKHYLANEKLRLLKAQAMHARALKERTVTRAAGQILDKWKGLL